MPLIVGTLAAHASLKAPPFLEAGHRGGLAPGAETGSRPGSAGLREALQSRVLDLVEVGNKIDDRFGGLVYLTAQVSNRYPTRESSSARRGGADASTSGGGFVVTIR